MSYYLIQTHDDGDTEVCKLEQLPSFCPYLQVSSRAELFAQLLDYGLGEREPLDQQLLDAGDGSKSFPWTRFY